MRKQTIWARQLLNMWPNQNLLEPSDRYGTLGVCTAIINRKTRVLLLSVAHHVIEPDGLWVTT